MCRMRCPARPPCGRADREPSRPPAFAACRQAQPRARRTGLQAFRCLRWLRAAALVACRILTCGSAHCVVRRLWHAQTWSRRSANLIDAHGAGRRRAVLHARRGDRRCSGGRISRRRVLTTSSPLTRANSGARALAAHFGPPGRLPKALKPTGKPLDIQTTRNRIRASTIDVRGSGALNAGTPDRARPASPRLITSPASRVMANSVAQRCAAVSAGWGVLGCRCRPARFCRRPPRAKTLARLVHGSCRQGQTRRRSVCGHRHFRLAARRSGTRKRRRQRFSNALKALRTCGCNSVRTQADRSPDA